MDDYTRGLLAGLLIGEGSFVVAERRGPPQLIFAVGMTRRHQRFLRDMQRAVGGVVYGPYESKGRNFVMWRIHRTAELVELCNLLDADRFVERCDWVAWRYTRFRTQHASASQLAITACAFEAGRREVSRGSRCPQGPLGGYPGASRPSLA